MPGFALLFPGQGSQHVGMGRDLYEASPAARAVLNGDGCAGLSRLMFEGPADTLTDTANAQPALLVASLACWAALQEALAGRLQAPPAFVAGHSMGEYTALAVAGALSTPAALRLVQARGQAMKAAGDAQPGGMAAILGLDAQTVAALCDQARAETSAPVVVANDNAPGQVVISGAQAAVQAATELARAAGARRVVPLAVSIAAHSPLMELAAERFRPALRQAELRPAAVPVVGNVSARPLVAAEDLIAELDAQLTSPVRWTDSVRYMVEQGVSVFVEVGPKDVLTGLVRRIAPQATCVACGTVEGVQQAARVLAPAEGQPWT